MSASLTKDAASKVPPLPEDIDAAYTNPLRDPVCYGLAELSGAQTKRATVAQYLSYQRATSPSGLTQPLAGSTAALVVELPHADNNGVCSAAEEVDMGSPLSHHLSQGLALTAGSALGSTPPDTSTCLAAFLVPNKAHLTAGARAWSKHAHRSQPQSPPSSPTGEPTQTGFSQDGDVGEGARREAKKNKAAKIRENSDGWWGRPSGPVAGINERALALFWKVVGGATWRNLHWLPHRVLVYEVRVEEGYGMRWSQDQSTLYGEDGAMLRGESHTEPLKPWVFRGFVEPMMENGHELGWKHPV